PAALSIRSHLLDLVLSGSARADLQSTAGRPLLSTLGFLAGQSYAPADCHHDDLRPHPQPEGTYRPADCPRGKQLRRRADRADLFRAAATRAARAGWTVPGRGLLRHLHFPFHGPFCAGAPRCTGTARPGPGYG